MPIESAAISVYIVVVALLLGSFINLAADRLPRGESVVSPPSHCRACGRRLNVLDLLPVVGYLIRGGRCATCGSAIGVASPAIEAACGAAMALSLALLGMLQGTVVGFVFVWLIGVSAVGLSYREGAR